MLEMPLYVKVDAVSEEANNIRAYRLLALDEGPLPEFTAGAHIGIVMPNKITRYYSICSSPRDRRHYIIGVQREDQGRGGSKLVHDSVRAGTMLKLQAPRNFFALAPSGSHVLIAGGIGITPILSMAAELEARGQDFQVIYRTRGREFTPFARVIDTLVACGRAQLFDQQDGPDFGKLLEVPSKDRHVYCCGSPGFMEHVRDACSHWDAGQVHFESFSPVVAQAGDTAFTIKAQQRGTTFKVAADQSILAAIRENGIGIDSVCENGTCGTCKVRYCSGEPEHRDSVLNPAEQREYLMACVSRAKSDLLVLDI